MKKETLDELKVLMKFTKKILFLALVVLVYAAHAQNLQYKSTDNSKLWFDGTSTLHDFTCYAHEIDARVSLSQSALGGEDETESTGEVVIQVKGIKHDNAKLTSNMYKILEPDKWPEINFNLKSVQLAEQLNGKDVVKGYINGDLTIKGETQKIQMPVEVMSDVDTDTLKVLGNYKLLLSDFSIEKPSFLLGTLKVGDEISVHIDMNFIPKTNYNDLTKK